MSLRSLGRETCPNDANMIWKRGGREREDVEQSSRVLRNNDCVSFDPKVSGAGGRSRFLKANNVARDMASSDDDGIYP
jgi:hypothetical protein